MCMAGIQVGYTHEDHNIMAKKCQTACRAVTNPTVGTGKFRIAYIYIVRVRLWVYVKVSDVYSRLGYCCMYVCYRT